MQLSLTIQRRTMRKPAVVQVRLYGSDRRPEVDAAFRNLHKTLVAAFAKCADDNSGGVDMSAKGPRGSCNARILFRYRRTDVPRPWSIRPDLSPAATVAECNTVNEVSDLLLTKGFRFASA